MGKKFVDSRAVDLKFLEDLKSGKLKYFLESVKNHPELELCFRGNRGNGKQAVTIYRDNHIVWDIETSDFEKYTVTISFNHARYTEKWKEKEIKGALEKLNFIVNDVVKKTKGENNTPSYDITNPSVTLTDYTKDFVETSYGILKVIFDDYFNYDGKHSINYFREEYNKKNNINESYKASKKACVEKIFQQKLFTNVLNGVHTRYFSYDLEFEQPYPTKEYKKNVKTNKPDMLAIKQEGEKYKLVLVEVKSTYAACEGKSDVIKHLDGMKDYLDEKIHYEFKGKVVYDDYVIKSRRKEAIDIIKAYQFLGLRKIEFNNNFWKYFSFDEDKLDEIIDGMEILVIFTDKNIGKKYNYRSDKNDAIKWYKSVFENKNNSKYLSIRDVVNTINKKNVVVKFGTYTDLNGLT